jgi:hypothetical protein
LTIAASVLIILPLNWGGTSFPWVSGPVLGCLLSSIAAFALFFFWEWKFAKIPVAPRESLSRLSAGLFGIAFADCMVLASRVLSSLMLFHSLHLQESDGRRCLLRYTVGRWRCSSQTLPNLPTCGRLTPFPCPADPQPNILPAAILSDRSRRVANPIRCAGHRPIPLHHILRLCRRPARLQNGRIQGAFLPYSPC